MQQNVEVLTPEEHQRRLSWQCRRGLKETDVLLNKYLTEVFLEDTQEHRQLFDRLLQSEDADMFLWFTGREEPEDPELAAFVHYFLRRLGPEGGIEA